MVDRIRWYWYFLQAANATPSLLMLTVYVLRWTISNGVCAASTDDVTVTYYESPTTATVGAKAECSAYSNVSRVLLPIPNRGYWCGRSFQVVQVLSVTIAILMLPSLPMLTELMACAGQFLTVPAQLQPLMLP
ncbi:MAG: hypothetical protein IPH84_18305 [Bacteroidales bacterium]|nr:hypothetical protein [Bacteroidales bacterium]